MQYLDFAIIIVVAFFALYGLWKGLVRIIFSIIAMVISIALAYWYSSTVAGWLGKYIPWSEGARENLAFLLIMIVVNRVVGLLFWILNKTVGFLWRLPFIGSLNRLLGMVVGLVEGVVVVGVVAAFLITHVPESGWLAGQLAGSQLTPLIAPLGAALLPGITGVMDTLSSLNEQQAGVQRIVEIVTSTLP